MSDKDTNNNSEENTNPKIQEPSNLDTALVYK